MALGSSNITMSAVATALGVSTSDIDLKNLCTNAAVNIWSRYKPGYFKTDGSSDNWLTYQAPRGGGTTDPRGTDSDVGHALETYKLGDFRGYDHDSDPPYAVYPSSTVEFGSGESTSYGITFTFYVEDVNWGSGSGDAYREQHDIADLTHVLLLDAADDSIEDAVAIPSMGSFATLTPDGISMSQGVPVTKTYHIAFGTSETNWAVKLGDYQGADGIFSLTVLRLEPAKVSGAIFVDTNFTGGDNDPYNSVEILGSNTNRINGTTQAIWDYSTLNAWRCYHSSGYDDYRSISADWYVKGFNENPTTEYFVKTANISSNGANNTIDLNTMSDTPPHSSWEDGDNMVLVLRNLTINF
jgi:hypothetical protein